MTKVRTRVDPAVFVLSIAWMSPPITARDHSQSSIGQFACAAGLAGPWVVESAPMPLSIGLRRFCDALDSTEP